VVAILLIPKNELEPGDRVSLVGSEPVSVERLPIVLRRDDPEELVIKEGISERKIKLGDVECVVRIVSSAWPVAGASIAGEHESEQRLHS
jgi:hypothetical protein